MQADSLKLSLNSIRLALSLGGLTLIPTQAAEVPNSDRALSSKTPDLGAETISIQRPVNPDSNFWAAFSFGDPDKRDDIMKRITPGYPFTKEFAGKDRLSRQFFLAELSRHNEYTLIRSKADAATFLNNLMLPPSYIKPSEQDVLKLADRINALGTLAVVDSKFHPLVIEHLIDPALTNPWYKAHEKLFTTIKWLEVKNQLKTELLAAAPAFSLDKQDSAIIHLRIRELPHEIVKEIASLGKLWDSDPVLNAATRDKLLIFPQLEALIGLDDTELTKLRIRILRESPELMVRALAAQREISGDATYLKTKMTSFNDALVAEEQRMVNEKKEALLANQKKLEAAEAEKKTFSYKFKSFVSDAASTVGTVVEWGAYIIVSGAVLVIGGILFLGSKSIHANERPPELGGDTNKSDPAEDSVARRIREEEERRRVEDLRRRTFGL